MSTVGLVVKRKPEVGALALRLSRTLTARGVVIAEDVATPCDLVVVLGGDGTFLRAAHLYGDRGIPLLGVNAGGLGFLTEFSVDKADDAIVRALAGELPMQERMRLRVTPEAGQPESALNDVVISQRGIARLLDVQAWLDTQLVAQYKADGLIVATPTGSTAYNLSAGGPILTPDLFAMVLTPICPHTLTNRPLVVPADAKLRLRVMGHAERPSLTVDGQHEVELAGGGWVEISAEKTAIRCVRNPDRPYFDLLREKLTWGVRER